MSACVIPGCPGQHHRYPDCLAEALWSMGEDYADESGGDSCEWYGYSMLFLIDESTWMSDWVKDFCDVYELPDFQVSGGTYALLTELDSGRIEAEYFTFRQEAVDAYDTFIASYYRWSEMYEH